uniref:ORF40aa n=1 Tax=Pinus koraiensis TaxID=88728 RepID=A4QMG7_PINKO|nr:ORF40aa [Pinus koraiensis]
MSSDQIVSQDSTNFLDRWISSKNQCYQTIPCDSFHYKRSQ